MSDSIKFDIKVLFVNARFSKHRPSGPMLAISRNVRLSVRLCVCVSVHFWDHPFIIICYLWPKSSEKKEDFEIKSDLFWQNTFLKLWKLKFVIIQFGSIRFWSIFLCFCVRYKVFSVYCTLSQTEKSSVNKEDFDPESRLTQSKQFLKI